MMSEQTVKCGICGKPYVFYSHYAGDQSVCPSCIREAGGSGDGQTIKCGICGKPYVFYSHYAGDQTACPACRSEARAETGGQWAVG